MVKKPFYQLLTINAFIARGGTKKQLPLIFAVMSGKSLEDYVTVCLFVVSAVHFTPYLTGLSSMMLI